MKKIRRMGANFKAKTIHKKKAVQSQDDHGMVRCTNVQCDTEQNFSHGISLSVQNAMGIMNIVKIIYLPISM